MKRIIKTTKEAPNPAIMIMSWESPIIAEIVMIMASNGLVMPNKQSRIFYLQNGHGKSLGCFSLVIFPPQLHKFVQKYLARRR